MNRYYIYIISCNTYKLLLRNKVFQLSFLIILGLITFFHVIEQSKWGVYPFLGEFNLASFIPYMNAYLFTLLQIVPLLFLVMTLGGKEEKLDSLDTLYYRPESNAEYVWGVTLGFTRAFMLMGCVSLVLAAMIHLLGNDALFNAWIYLFYLFTLLFPAFIFTYGICLLVKCCVGHRLLSLVLLLLYFIVTIFYIGDWWGGVLDPTGTTLPNAFSEIEGHPDMVFYLIQRLGWLLIGLGCIQLSVMGFKRLPNTPGKGVKRVGTVLPFWIIGIVMIGVYAMVEQEKRSARREYVEVYSKYANVKKMALINQEIDFTQNRDRMEVNSRLTMRNEMGEVMPEIVLYLNPGLEVFSIRVKGEDVPFKRESQVIVVGYPISPGDSLELHVAYGGKIDENICYLDITDDVIYDTWQTRYLTCRFGNRYAFLDERFTLLTPEILWYPMTKPIVNLDSPYEGSKDFTCYTLNVTTPVGKTVMAQGRKEVHEDTVSFYNNVPLIGLSLCIGDYETRSVMIDSVECNLYVFRRGTSFFDAINSYDNSLNVDKSIEFRDREYPFSRLSLVETPVSFTSYFREGRVSSEFIQPELVFLPERLANRVSLPEKFDGFEGYTPKLDLNDVLCGILLNNSKTTIRHSWINDLIFKRNIKDVLLNSLRRTDNPYYILPLFFEHDAFLQSENYLVINTINRYILNNDYEQYDQVGGTRATVWDALEYLNGHSLREALRDEKLPREVVQDILILKTLELVNYFNYHGVETDRLKVFIADYLERHAFRKIDFTQFDSDFREEFGIDWTSVLPSWLEDKQIPTYLIKDFRVKEVLSGGPYSASEVLVEFSIFNDSDVDGIVNLQSSCSSFNDGGGLVSMSFGDRKIEPLKQSYLLEARTGKKVSLHIPKSLPFFGLNTGISRNIPRTVAAFSEKVDHIEGYEEYIYSIEKGVFLPAKNEIIVDNTDEGFRVIEARRFNLRDYFTGKTITRKKYENLYGYVFLNNEWKTLADNNAYGVCYRSLVVRTNGTGESALEWCTKLNKDGEYEILVYVPEFSYTNVFLESMEHGKVGMQEYTITLPNGEVKKVQVDASNMVGWIFLGRFDCTIGECKITLKDVGKKDQMMIGDAVKWVYVDDTEEKE